MLNILLVLLGIVVMIFAIKECDNIRHIATPIDLKSPMRLILILLHLFLIGYIAYAVFLVTTVEKEAIHTLVSFILCFGSIFVVITKKVNFKLLQTLAQKTKEITENNNRLMENQTQLKKTEQAVQQKNAELVEALEDFYTLRLSLEKNDDKQVIASENRQIKQRLDEMKEN